MPVQTFREGIVSGGVGGHRLLYPGPVLTRRPIWYVDGSKTQAADDSNHGKHFLKPFDTLAYAHNTAASAGDIIVVAATHRAPTAGTSSGIVFHEIVSLTCSKARVSILGLGAGSTRCRLQGSSAPVFTITAAGVEARNFILNDVNDDEAASGWPVDVQAAGVCIGDMEFRCNLATRAIMLTSGSYPIIENCTFENVRTTDSTSFVLYGIYISDGVNGIRLDGCEFDGGQFSFQTAAVYQPAGATNTGFFATDCVLENDADMIFDGTVRGMWIGTVMDGSCTIKGDKIRFAPAGWIDEDDSALNESFASTGDTYFLDNSAANADDANAGTDPAYPLDTLGQALFNFTASNGDLIVMRSGHSEDIAGALGTSVHAIAEADVTIIGLGSGSGRPQLRVTGTPTGAGDTTLLAVTGANFRLIGVQFRVSTYTPTVSGKVVMMSLSTEGIWIENCSFTMGARDSIAIDLAGTCTPFLIRSCDFELSAAGPVAAIYSDDATGTGYAEIADCIFDGSSSQLRWTSQAVAFTSSSDNPASILTPTLRNRARISISSAGSSNTMAVSGVITDAPAAVVWG